MKRPVGKIGKIGKIAGGGKAGHDNIAGAGNSGTGCPCSTAPTS